MTGQIGALICLGFVALILIVIGYSVKTDEDDDGLNMFIVGLVLLVLASLGIGLELGLEADKIVNKKIKPQVKIECVDEKCDTMYIYKFNEVEK